MNSLHTLRITIYSLLGSVLASQVVLGSPSTNLTGEWRAIGPFGGSTQDFVVAPSQPSRMYLYGYGFWRTDDRGDQWRPIMTGLSNLPTFFSVLSVGAMAVSPVDPDLVLITNDGVFRTESGGDSWERSDAGITTKTVHALHFLRSEPTTALAATSEGIFVSTDSGKTWGVRAGGVTVRSLASHAAHPGVVLAATGGDLLRSADFGATWAPVDAPPGCHSTPSTVHWSASDANRIFAVGGLSLFHEEGGVSRSDDAGMSFQALTVPTEEDETYCTVGSIATHPSDPDLVVVSARKFFDFGLYHLIRHIVFRSEDGGATWSTQFDRNQGTFPFRNFDGGVAIDPEDANVTYVGMTHAFGTGFWKSEFAGQDDWELKTEGITGQHVRAMEIDARGSVFVRSNVGTGLWKSSPPYGTWTALPAVSPATPASRVSSFQVNRKANPTRMTESGNRIDIDVVTGFYDAFRDEGEVWSHLMDSTPVSVQGDGTLATNHFDGTVAYYWGIGQDDQPYTFRSTQADLSTWEIRGNHFVPEEAVISPSSAEIVFARLAFSPPIESFHPVVVSTNGGTSWEGRSAGLPPHDNRNRPKRLLMDPSDESHLLLVFEESAPWETTDGGKTWTQLEVNLAGATVLDADWRPSDRRVFLATLQGVLDSKAGWLDGLPTSYTSIVRYSEFTNTLFVATPELSVYAKELESRPTSTPDLTTHREHLRVMTHPVPFSRGVTIEFAIQESRLGDVAIYDVQGRLVRRLMDGKLVKGSHVLEWDGHDIDGRRLGGGVYFVRVRSGDATATSKVTLLR